MMADHQDASFPWWSATDWPWMQGRKIRPTPRLGPKNKVTSPYLSSPVWSNPSARYIGTWPRLPIWSGGLGLPSHLPRLFPAKKENCHVAHLVRVPVVPVVGSPTLTQPSLPSPYIRVPVWPGECPKSEANYVDHWSWKHFLTPPVSHLSSLLCRVDHPWNCMSHCHSMGEKENSRCKLYSNTNLLACHQTKSHHSVLGSLQPCRATYPDPPSAPQPSLPNIHSRPPKWHSPGQPVFPPRPHVHCSRPRPGLVLAQSWGPPRPRACGLRPGQTWGAPAWASSCEYMEQEVKFAWGSRATSGPSIRGEGCHMCSKQAYPSPLTRHPQGPDPSQTNPRVNWTQTKLQREVVNKEGTLESALNWI